MEFVNSIISNIDATIVIMFLAVNLGVGFYYGRNVKTIKDYALGGRNFSTATLASTIVATWIGGSFFAFLVSKAYSDGIYYIVPILIDYAVTFFIIGYFIAPRMKEFLGDISVAESMGKLYGKHVRIITAVSGFFAVSGLIAVQFKVASMLLSNFFDISEINALLITSTVVILYSSFGGIKSVAFTDVLQFFTFGTTIPILGILIWKDIKDIDQVIDVLVKSKNYGGFEFSFHNPSFINMLQLSLIFLIPALHPSLFQRISMSVSTSQVRRSFVFSSIMSVFFVLVTCWIGILMLTANPNLPPDTIWIYILNNYTSAGFKGLAIIGIIAMVMSTADSYINSSSILISNDVFKVFNPVSEQKQLYITKISALIIGIVSIILSIMSSDLLELVLIANNFYMPIVTVPLLLAIFGFRSSSKAVIIGMSSGLITVVLWRLFVMNITGIDSVLPGIVSNLIFFLGSHYLLNQEGGWKKEVDQSKARAQIIPTIDNTKFNISKCCIKNLPTNNVTYIFFGMFCIVSVFSSIYSLSFGVRTQYIWIVEVMAFFELLIATCFLLYPIWKFKNNKNIISIFWTISLLYSLTFKTGVELLISHFSHYQLMIYLASTIVLSILLRWQAALPIMFIGAILAFIFFKFIVGNNVEINIFKDIQFKLIYSLILVSSIIIAFLKPKQEQMEETEAKVDGLEEEVDNLGNVVGSLNTKITDLNHAVMHYSERVQDQQQEIERLGATAQKILNNVNHELRLPVGNVMNFAEMLSDGLGKFNKKQLKMLSDEVLTNSNRLSTMILNMLDLATLDVKKIELQKQTINLSELVSDRIKSCRKIYLQDKLIDFEMAIEPEILISLDPNYIKQTIDNLVINAITYSNSGVIKISVLRKDKNMVEITIKDQGIGIPKAELYDIFTPFKMGTNTESKAQGRGVGLALCKSAIEAHGGVITVESNGKGALFRIVLPF